MQMPLNRSWDWELALWAACTLLLHLGPTALPVRRFLHLRGACLQQRSVLRQQLERRLGVAMEFYLFDQLVQTFHRTSHGDPPTVTETPGGLFHLGTLYPVRLSTPTVEAGGLHLKMKGVRKVVPRTLPQPRGTDPVLPQLRGALPRRTVPLPTITRTVLMWWVPEEIGLASVLEWTALDAVVQMGQQTACSESWLWRTAASH
mmetsp:Transcript_32360/g.60196  ORF Transcript_32360/g.60196 Transcript_32360/m.60196 type:complete len:203 (-) Transcript_32360:158-766(-)